MRRGAPLRDRSLAFLFLCPFEQADTHPATHPEHTPMEDLSQMPDDVRGRIVEFLLMPMSAKDVVPRGARLARALLGPRSLGADGAAYRLVAERLKLEPSAERPTWRSVVQQLRAEWLQLSPYERYGTIDERALEAAARLDLELIARACLKAGRDKNGTSGDNIRYLWLATVHGSLRVVQVLLDAGANFKGSHEQFRMGPQGLDAIRRHVSGHSVLGVASALGHVDIMKALLVAGAEIDFVDSLRTTALMYASEFGKLEAIRTLLAAGANINFQRYEKTALGYAGACNQIEAVDELIAAGADPNTGPDDTGYPKPLWMASSKGLVTIVKALLRANADIEARGPNNGTPLIAACDRGRFKVARELLAAGAEVNARTSDNQTALMRAISYGSPCLVNELLAAGADVTARDAFDQSALALVICTAPSTMEEDARAQLVWKLVEKGVEIDYKIRNRVTVLYLACSLGLETVVAALIQAGADVNVQCHDYYTPLIVACRKGRVAIVRQLLAAKADMTAMRGQAIKGASAEGQYEVVRLLLAEGAKKRNGGLTAAAVAAGSAEDAEEALQHAINKNNKRTARMLELGGASMSGVRRRL